MQTFAEFSIEFRREHNYEPVPSECFEAGAASERQESAEREMRLRDALQHIAEYWNGCANMTALEDAVHVMEDTATAALTPSAAPKETTRE